MDIRSLRYFSEVVNCGGFSRASMILHVTQPAISRAVRLLEEELGVVLLIRDPKSVTLTREGEVVYRHAMQMTRRVRELTSELADIKSGLRGTLRLGLPPLVGAPFFSDVIAHFRKQCPGVELQITELLSSHLEQALDDGDIDIAVAMLPVDTDRFVVQPFALEQLVFVVPRGHGMAALSGIPIQTLKTEPLVTFTQDFKLRALIEDSCRAQGFAPSIAGRSSHLDLVLAMVASGIGVTVLPKLVIEKAKASQFVAIPIEPLICIELALVRPRESYLSQVCMAWIEVAADILAFKVSASFVSQTGS